MMNHINPIYTFGDWWMALLLMGVFYFILRVAMQTVQQYVTSSIIKRKALHVLNGIYTLYEPLVVCILLVLFVLISPTVHGLLVLALFAIFYSVLRKYLFGRLLLFTNNLEKGQHIKVQSSEGVIQQLNKLGLLLKTSQGNQQVYYDTLLAEGYTLLKGKEVRQIYELQLTPLHDEEKITIDQIKDKLLMCTFLDWNNRPHIKSIDNNKITVKVQTHEERHFEYLVALLSEDYKAEVQN